MQFTVLQANLQKALGVVNRAVNQRSPLPILGNILIRAEVGRVKLTASDLQITISANVGAKVDDPGEIAVPARILTEFANQISDEKIDFILDGSTLKLHTDRADASLSCMPAADFPDLEPTNDGFKISLDSNVITKAISQVQFAAATDESRPVLAGIFCKIEGNKFILAGTDGYRMAEYKIEIPESSKEVIKAIVPAKAFSDIVKAFVSWGDKIELIINNSQNIVRVKTEDIEAQIRMIEGDYPDYEAVVPKEFSTEIKIARSELLNGMRLASIFSKDMGNSVKIVANGDNLETKSQPSETGSNSTKMKGDIEGDNIEITFNAKYILDFLNNIDEVEISFRASEPLKPGFFQINGDKNYFFLAMPMKANW